MPFASLPDTAWRLDLPTTSAANLCLQNLRPTHVGDVTVEVRGPWGIRIRCGFRRG